MPRPFTRPLVRPPVRPHGRGASTDDGSGTPTDLAPTVPFTQPWSATQPFADDFQTTATSLAALDASAYNDGVNYFTSGVASIGPGLVITPAAPDPGTGFRVGVVGLPLAIDPAVNDVGVCVTARVAVAASGTTDPDVSPLAFVGDMLGVELVDADFATGGQAGLPSSVGADRPDFLVQPESDGGDVTPVQLAAPYSAETPYHLAMHIHREPDGTATVYGWAGPSGALVRGVTTETMPSGVALLYLRLLRRVEEADGALSGVAGDVRLDLRPGLSRAAFCAAFGVTLPA